VFLEDEPLAFGGAGALSKASATPRPPGTSAVSSANNRYGKARPHDLSQANERGEIRQRVGLKNPIEDLVSLLVIVALEVAEKLAANHLHIAGLADNYGSILYRRLGFGLFGAGLPWPLDTNSESAVWIGKPMA